MSNSLLAGNTNSGIDKKKVEIYSTEYCPYCTRARMLLESKGVSYVEFRVDRDVELRQEMETRSRRRSVPQIFIGDRHIGGFDELARLEVGEQLDNMLGLDHHI
jgi:glutaredoxin 3